ncbi:SGNH/GDSL hydrolase family protein [Paenibacillus endoradicis]|uniref:SGNH/GDSL hydrolase family protein n=1 Tax=Paenibacillus endoradicis TaxID=2972487 RepID=UPI00215972C6|nr:SGNH/GDSL hydrolase family protein [Paenibacillus endoradicis]MCR8659633.1 hypothetical protein [Paenibacillus endoradicis]
MTLPYWIEREPLTVFQQCISAGTVTLGFIGGSITDGRSRSNWPEYVVQWLAVQYPNVRFRVENAAIGATGSDFGVFRAQRDLIERGCDVVFIEYAVNDDELPTVKRHRSREGLIRKLLREDARDLILVYTFCDTMLDPMVNGLYPPSIIEFEQLANHYHLPSIWVGKYGLDQVKSGRLSMEEWLPDGIHPLKIGSSIYAECVISFLQKQLQRNDRISNVNNHAFQHDLLIQPLDAQCWEEVYELPFTQIVTNGRWLEQRWHDYEWMDTVLETTEIGASLTFVFEGRGLVLAFDFGYQSAEFHYRIDGGAWIESNRDCPDWVGVSGWYRLFDCGDDLQPGEHHFELVVQHRDPEKNQETYFRLGKVGIIT